MAKKLEIALVFIGIVAITCLFFATPKEKISVSEKRVLSTLPAFTWDNYISGQLAKGINQYINDIPVLNSAQ